MEATEESLLGARKEKEESVQPEQRVVPCLAAEQAVSLQGDVRGLFCDAAESGNKRSTSGIF